MQLVQITGTAYNWCTNVCVGMPAYVCLCIGAGTCIYAYVNSVCARTCACGCSGVYWPLSVHVCVRA